MIKGLDRSCRDEILRQHDQCTDLVARVEAAVDRPAALGESLEDLARSLRDHFAEEEQGCLFLELPLSSPQYASRLEVLEAEHESLLAAVEAARAEACGFDRGTPGDLRALGQRVRALVATLRRHEADENEILRHVHWDDTGTGD